MPHTDTIEPVCWLRRPLRRWRKPRVGEPKASVSNLLSMPRQIVRAYVRPDLRSRFQEQFPGTGSVSWLLETAMTEVLAITEGQPAITQLVRSAIRAAILRERQAQRTQASNDQSTGSTSVRVIPLHPDGKGRPTAGGKP